MKAYSQGTENWKESTKGIAVSAYNPIQTSESSTERQVTEKGLEIAAPASDQFVHDLQRATRKLSAH